MSPVEYGQSRVTRNRNSGWVRPAGNFGILEIMNLTLSQRAKPSGDVLFQEVGGEAVLLDMATETYFGLDPVGTRIWKLLGEDPGLRRAHEALCAEYDATPATLEKDLLELVAELAQAKLVAVE